MALGGFLRASVENASPKVMEAPNLHSTSAQPPAHIEVSMPHTCLFQTHLICCFLYLAFLVTVFPDTGDSNHAELAHVWQACKPITLVCTLVALYSIHEIAALTNYLQGMELGAEGLTGWAGIERHMAKYDTAMVQDYADDIDTLLVFVGPFPSLTQ